MEDFPGGPVVKNSPFNEGGAVKIPGQGAKSPRDSKPKKTKNQKTKTQNIKIRSNIVTDSIMTF